MLPLTTSCNLENECDHYEKIACRKPILKSTESLPTICHAFEKIIQTVLTCKDVLLEVRYFKQYRNTINPYTVMTLIYVPKIKGHDGFDVNLRPVFISKPCEVLSLPDDLCNLLCMHPHVSLAVGAYISLSHLFEVKSPSISGKHSRQER